MAERKIDTLPMLDVLQMLKEYEAEGEIRAVQQTREALERRFPGQWQDLSSGADATIPAPNEAATNVQPQASGGVLGDLAKSTGSGLVRGTAGGLDMPGMITNFAISAAEAAYEKATGKKADPAFRESVISSLSATPLTQLLSKERVTPALEQAMPSVMNFEPETKGGEYAQRAAEFVPFAGKKLISQAVIPASASKAVGESGFVEGTAMQVPAEILTAIFSPVIAKRLVSPSGGQIAGETKKAVDLLYKEGVIPTAAQSTGNKAAAYMEEATVAGQDLIEAANRNFSRAALKRIGIDSDIAAPELMQQKYNELGQRFSDGIGRVEGAATQAEVDDLAAIIKEYAGSTNKNLRAPIFANILAAMDKSIDGFPIKSSELRTYHQTLNKMTRQGDNAGSAAREAIEVLTGVIDRGLGPEQAAAWRKLNAEYRDFLAIEDAVSKAGPALQGIVSPQHLRGSTKTVFGKRAYVLGKSDLAELAKAGSIALKPMPSSGTAERLIARTGGPAPATGAAGYFGAQMIGNNVDGAGVDPSILGMAGLGGLLAPKVINEAAATKPGQAYLRNQLIKELDPQNALRMTGASMVGR